MATQLKVSVLLESIAETQGFQRFNQEMRATQMTVKKMQPALTASAAGFTLVAATVGVVAQQAIKLGSNITDLANQANIGTDALQVLALTALDSGVSMEEVSKSAVMLRKNIQEAREGNKGMTESLAKLNLTAAGLQALAPERQWELIAKSIANAKDKQAALNAASELFGAKNAPKLMEVLQRLGVDGYDKLAQGTEKIRLSPEQLKTLDDAGDKLGRIVENLKYIAAKGTVEVLKVFNTDGPTVSRADAATNARKRAAEMAQTAVQAKRIADASAPLLSDIQIRTLGRGNKALMERYEAQNKVRQAARDAIAAEQKQAEAARSKAMADAETNAAAEDASLAAIKRIKENVTAWGKAEAQKQKTVDESNEAIKRAEEQTNKDRLASAKRYQDALDAVANQGVNDYQKRGLALGPSGVALPGAVGANPFPEAPRAPVPVISTTLNPNSAGREDGATKQILKSMDKSLIAVARVIEAWA